MVPLPSLAEIPELQALQSQVRRLWAAQTVVVLARIAAFGSLGRPSKGGKSLQDLGLKGVVAMGCRCSGKGWLNSWPTCCWTTT